MLNSPTAAPPRTSIRHLLAFSVVLVFVTYVLVLGISKEAKEYAQELRESLSDSVVTSHSKLLMFSFRLELPLTFGVRGARP